jgi:hypothetical protein
MAWDNARKWDELWGKLTVDGLVWKYYDVVASPGARFRLKFHWPKPIVRGECYLTDILVTRAAPGGQPADAAAVATESDSVEPSRLVLELSTPVNGNLYYLDEPLQFEALVYAKDDADIALPGDARLVWEISDFQRFFLARGEAPFADAKPVADPAFYKSRLFEVVPERARNVTKSFVVDNPDAKPVGQELFIEVKLMAGGRMLASETMPYGVVNPRAIDPRDYGKCRFIHHWFWDGLHFTKSSHERQSLADRLGISLAYGHAPNWKASQPAYPGPYDFGEKKPPFPKLVIPFNLEQERGRKADGISWGRTVEEEWKSWVPPECVIDDPLHPGCPTFEIDPYVEFMVAYIRHNRESISMVVPAGLERPIDARTFELHKKAYTAIKKEFPDLPVGFMIYGLFMNPSEAKQQFVREDLFDYVDFIDNHLYASAVDWTEWEDLQLQFKKRGKDIFLISTEMAIVSGAAHIPRAKGTIMGSLDAFAHDMRTIYYFNQANHYSKQFSPPITRDIPRGSDQGMNFLHMQMVARPKVSPDITLANGYTARWSPFDRGGTSYMPVLQTLAYYNTVQNYEAADFRETRNPDATCVAQVFDRRDATVVGLYLTRPIGFKTYAVRTETVFTAQDMFGRNTRVTPLDGTALISVDDSPLTLIFDQRTDAFAIEPVDGGAAIEPLAKGGAAKLAVALPGVFSGTHTLRVSCTVDGTWPASEAATLAVEPNVAAAVALPIAVGPEQPIGEYPLTARVFEGDALVGLLRSNLKITELLRLEVEGLPITLKTDPAIQVTVVSLKEEPVEGVIRFDNRQFCTSLRDEIEEAPFRVPSRGEVKVRLPVPRDLVNLTTTYDISVTATAKDGTRVSRREEVAFRACEKAPGGIVIDGDLADWKLDGLTPVPMAREW